MVPADGVLQPAHLLGRLNVGGHVLVPNVEYLFTVPVLCCNAHPMDTSMVVLKIKTFKTCQFTTGTKRIIFWGTIIT
jgi:hypothetical protein